MLTTITQEIPKPEALDDPQWEAILSILYLEFRKGHLPHVFIEENCYLTFISDPLSKRFITILTHHSDVKPETLEEIKKIRSEAALLFSKPL